jgi:hypothetical protein
LNGAPDYRSAAVKEKGQFAATEDLPQQGCPAREG